MKHFEPEINDYSGRVPSGPVSTKEQLYDWNFTVMQTASITTIFYHWTCLLMLFAFWTGVSLLKLAEAATLLVKCVWLTVDVLSSYDRHNVVMCGLKKEKIWSVSDMDVSKIP